MPLPLLEPKTGHRTAPGTLPARPVAVRAHRNADDLLSEFSVSGTEECFEEIVRRYGAMVLSVCRRETRHRQDAEDATQVVFLVLAERLRAGEKIRSPGAWLAQVGKRAAADIRRSRARRRRREQARAASEITHTPLPDDGDAVARIVREELERIPAKYRIPLILHYFNGQNFVDAAGVLGIKPSTLGVRIFRGRKLLAERLARRGFQISSVALVALLATVVRRSVSDALVKAVARAAVTGGAGASVSAGPLALGQGLAAFAASSQVKMIAAAVLLAAAAVGARAAVQWRPEIPSFLHPRRIVPPIPNLRTNLPRLRADAQDSGKLEQTPGANQTIAAVEKTTSSLSGLAIAPWLARRGPVIGPPPYIAPPLTRPFVFGPPTGIAATPVSPPFRNQPLAFGMPAASPPPPFAKQRGATASDDDMGARAAPGRIAAGPPQQDHASAHKSPGPVHATGPHNVISPQTSGSLNDPALNPNPPTDGAQSAPPGGATGPGASFQPNSILGPGTTGPGGSPILGPGTSQGTLISGTETGYGAFSGPGSAGSPPSAVGFSTIPGQSSETVVSGNGLQFSAGGAADHIHYDSIVTPEPASAGLFAIGAAGLLLRRRRKSQVR